MRGAAKIKPHQDDDLPGTVLMSNLREIDLAAGNIQEKSFPTVP